MTRLAFFKIHDYFRIMLLLWEPRVMEFGRLGQVFWSKAETDYKMGIILGKGGHSWPKAVGKTNSKLLAKMNTYDEYVQNLHSHKYISDMWYFYST